MTGAEVADQLVRASVIVSASAIIWTKVAAPLIFRPIGKALAHGARHEAELVVHELVDPQVALLKEGQAALEQRLDALTSKVGEVLDRMPPSP